MPKSTVISVDAMGGDHGPSVIVPGIALAADRWSERGVRFLLHGAEDVLKAELARAPAAAKLCEIRHTDLVIAIAMLILRMMGDLERPALVARWPSLAGATTVLDVGANIDCDAKRLAEFAMLGEAFHRALYGVAHPTVGLLNVGAEDQKGHEEVREAHRMLREGGVGLNYFGFVEGGDISKSVVDVVVTDGFTGNVALKTAEGTARFIGAELRSALTGSLLDKIGAAIAQGALRKLMTRLNPSTLDGAPLLGLNGLVVKCHGGTDARGFSNGLRVAVDLAESQYAEEITASLQRLTATLAAKAPDTVAKDDGAAPEKIA